MIWLNRLMMFRRFDIIIDITFSDSFPIEKRGLKEEENACKSMIL